MPRLWRCDIPIEEFRRVLDYDPQTGEFRNKEHRSANAPAGAIAGCESGRGYWLLSLNSRLYFAHRVAWAFIHGSCPEHLDHINGNGLDNRIENLRPATQTLNNRNMKTRRRKIVKSKGVTRWSQGELVYFRARIIVDKREISLGYYKTEPEAAEAYRVAAQKHFGEFARV